MRWLLVVAVFLSLLLAIGLGWWLGKKGKNHAIAVMAVGLVALAFRLLFNRLPALEDGLFPFPLYAILRPWSALPFAGALLAAGSHHMSRPGERRGVLVLAFALFPVVGNPLIATALLDPKTFTGVPLPRDGVCRQTTDFSCGAAAASTLLHALKVPSTEAELAELCWTNALTGTDIFCVARGLRLKLAGTGREVRVVSSDWDRLVARGSSPSMATIQYGFLVDHWVTVLGVEEGRLLVGDPLAGPRRFERAEFEAVWRGFLVTADPP